MKNLKKILIANRSEIAIRISRAATELGFQTVSIYSYEDRFALHRFKTDESYLVGSGKGPIQAYLDYEGIVKLQLIQDAMPFTLVMDFYLKIQTLQMNVQNMAYFS